MIIDDEASSLTRYIRATSLFFNGMRTKYCCKVETVEYLRFVRQYC